MSAGIRGATADDGWREGRRRRTAGVATLRAPMLAACAVLLLAMPVALPVAAQQAAADADVQADEQALDEQALRADMQRMIERRRRELLPGYERRVRSEGRERADAWLREQAQKLGREDGAEVRRRHARGRYDAQDDAPARDPH